jgi:hypothetical protein
MKLGGENIAEQVLVPKKNGYRPEQTANEKGADLLQVKSRPVFAVTM